MTQEILEQLLKNGQQFPIMMTPEALSGFAAKIANDTAQMILSNVKFDEKPIPEKEACKILNKSRQSLIKYRKSGRLRYHRIGREIYYLQSEINEDLKRAAV
jgi:hypothetical protein